MCGLKQACGTFCCCEVYLSCVLAVWLSVCVDPLLKTSFGCSSEWQCVTSVIFCKLLFSRLLSLCRQTRWELVLLLPVVVVVIIKAFLNHTRTFIKCVKDIYLTHSVTQPECKAFTYPPAFRVSMLRFRTSLWFRIHNPRTPWRGLRLQSKTTRCGFITLRQFTSSYTQGSKTIHMSLNTTQS